MTIKEIARTEESVTLEISDDTGTYELMIMKNEILDGATYNMEVLGEPREFFHIPEK
jgi:hypothetical protein